VRKTGRKIAAVLGSSDFLDVEKRFRRIMGHRDLRTLKAILDEKQVDEKREPRRMMGRESSPTTLNCVLDSIEDPARPIT